MTTIIFNSSCSFVFKTCSRMTVINACHVYMLMSKEFLQRVRYLMSIIDRDMKRSIRENRVLLGLARMF